MVAGFFNGNDEFFVILGYNVRKIEYVIIDYCKYRHQKLEELQNTQKF